MTITQCRRSTQDDIVEQSCVGQSSIFESSQAVISAEQKYEVQRSTVRYYSVAAFLIMHSMTLYGSGDRRLDSKRHLLYFR